MKRIQVPLAILIVMLVGYGLYKMLASNPLKDIEMELMVEAAGSTQYMTQLRRVDNERIMSSMTELVRLNFDRKRDHEVLEKARFAREMTADLMKEIAGIREKAIKSAGSVDERGNVTGRGRKVRLDSKEMLTLSIGLKHYSDTLSVLTETELSSLLVSPEGEVVSPLNFYRTYFKDKMLSVFLLNLASVENDLAMQERRTLDGFGRIINYTNLEFDSLLPIVSTESRVVEEGDYYKAEISVAAIDPDIPIIMSIDNEPVQVEEGIGKVVLSPEVKASDFRGGEAEKSWRGTVAIGTRYGLTTYNVKQDYKVKKKN